MDGERLDGPGAIQVRQRLMRARLTEAHASVSALPLSNGSPTRSSTRGRDGYHASFPRELRCSLDSEGLVAHAQGAWQAVLGWHPEDLNGWYWEQLVHPGDHVRVNHVLRRLSARPGCERDIDLRLALRVGGYHHTTWTFVSGAGVESILCLGLDDNRSGPSPRSSADALLAEQTVAELAARLHELEERYAAVEHFAATAAHHLAEPLVVAESSAILVAEELGADLDPMLRGRLEAIGRSAARARRLMDALLTDARTAEGGTSNLRSVDATRVVEEVLASLEPQVEQRRASVLVAPLPHLRGEPELLSVVLENLVSNALKYGPRSDGRIVIAAEPSPTGWRIAVVSEGMPIPKEEAARIFQPFHRAPDERRIPGVGLGLAICARLVGRLGGTVGVEPGAESGNTFWIELPAAA
jgi:signal transduction histidine kinase